MYYKIKNNIIFRKYSKFGYITDNSMFGYRALNDDSSLVGEEYVSESGAVMLGGLTKAPQHIDDICKKLFGIFVDVEYDELKQDAIDFYNKFVIEGFLSFGETVDKCNNSDDIIKPKEKQRETTESAISIDKCSKNIFNQKDFLRSLHIEIANECNERCVHCYIPHEYKTKIIDSDLFYRILEEGRELNIINVTLSGGEPLLHKDFIKFLVKCRELDLSVNILTNLTLLTDEIISEMKKNPLLCVQTSIYSMDSSLHDSITKVRGSFEKTKNGLLKLKEAGIPLQISCPIIKQNKDSFADVIEWGNKNNIAVATDYVIFAAYDHSNCNLANRLSLTEVGQAFDKQISKEYINALCNLAETKTRFTKKDPICSICRYYICVSAEGNVFPCIGWQTNIIGDLNKQTLKTIWESSNDIKMLRQIKLEDFPKCVECNNRGYCTVCMMSNSNENSNGDPFRINDYHCKVAAMIHDKVNSYLNELIR